MNKLFAMLAAAGFVAAAAAAPASAQQFPASVVGGPWTWNANQGGVTTRITSQTPTGTCNQILGTMQAAGSTVVDTLQGYYCPMTGQIAMLRKNARTNVTYQVWTGQLDATTAPLQIYATGSFISVSVGATGSFFFSGDMHMN